MRGIPIAPVGWPCSTVIDAELPSVPEAGPPPRAAAALPAESPKAPEQTAQGSKWTDDEDQRLVAAFQEGVDVAALAKAHRRTPKAILLRLSQTHRLLKGERLTSMCELYGVSLNSPGRDKKPARKGTRTAEKSPQAAHSVFL